MGLRLPLRTRSGDSTTTHRWQVTVLDLPGDLPELHVGPASVLGRVGAALGLQDIALESETFNNRFRVQASDPKFASDVLSTRLMAELLKRPWGVEFRLERGALWCADTGRQEVSGVRERLALLRQVADAIPGFVWTDHGVTPPNGH